MRLRRLGGTGCGAGGERGENGRGQKAQEDGDATHGNDSAFGAGRTRVIDLRSDGIDGDAVRTALQLAPHPEGGAYRETWRDAPAGGGRGAATSILFLLDRGERSAWHRVDAAELWLWQAGGPIALRIAPPDEAASCSPRQIRLGPDGRADETLQAVVPAGWWQTARPAGDRWALAACIVAPAFLFERFELAPPGALPE